MQVFKILLASQRLCRIYPSLTDSRGIFTFSETIPETVAHCHPFTLSVRIQDRSLEFRALLHIHIIKVMAAFTTPQFHSQVCEMWHLQHFCYSSAHYVVSEKRKKKNSFILRNTRESCSYKHNSKIQFEETALLVSISNDVHINCITESNG